jgi:hypothetical protein
MNPCRLQHALIVSAVLLMGSATGACSQPSFADKTAEKLRAALPGYQVTIVDDMTLRVGKPSAPPDQQMQVNLDRVADYCHRAPDDCQTMLSDYVAKTVDMVKSEDIQPSVASLRAVVRPAAYVAELGDLMRKRGQSPVSAPLVGDLAVLCYFDLPATMRPVGSTDLAKLGVPPQGALDRCRANTRAALPELTHLKPQPQPSGKKGAIMMLTGDPYESSYLALHDEWSTLAAAFGGRLLIAAPDADQVLVTQDQGPDSVKVLSTLAREGYQTAERPISRAVFRWTPTGWAVAAP